MTGSASPGGSGTGPAPDARNVWTSAGPFYLELKGQPLT